MTQISKVSLNQGGQDASPAKVQSGNYSYLLKQSNVDSASFGNKEKKDGMSMGAKIALLAAGIAAAGGAIYLAVRRGRLPEVKPPKGEPPKVELPEVKAPDFVMNGEATVVNLSNKAQKDGLTVSSNFSDEVQETATSGQLTKTKVVDLESSDIIRQRTGDSIVSRAKEEVDGATKVYLSLKKEIDDVIAKITPEELEKIPLDANGSKMINIPNKNKTYRLIYDKDGKLKSARLSWQDEYGEECSASFSNGMATINNYGRYKVAHFEDGELCNLDFQKYQDPLDIVSINERINENGYRIQYRTTGKNTRLRCDTISIRDFQTMFPPDRLNAVPIERPKFKME